jgi:hypothetical protein
LHRKKHATNVETLSLKQEEIHDMNQHTKNETFKTQTFVLNSDNARVRNFGNILRENTLEKRDLKTQYYALEISLYSLFASFIFLMMVLPNQAISIVELFPNTELNDPVGFMLWVKMSLFVSSLVPLFWALHYSSKRLKGRLLAKKN